MIINNKIRKLFSILFISIILICTTSGCSFSKGRFIELDFKQEDNNQPVALNDNEIFFAGGFDGNDHGKINPAKIYNVKEKKLTSLNVTMNFPRVSYGAIKYDDNHILIVGGSCADTDLDRNNECSKLAEIYDIKANKFTRIKNSNLSYMYDVDTILLPNGNIFIMAGNEFEIFNPKDLTFKIVSKIKKPYSYRKDKYIYTYNNYFTTEPIVLNNKEILIFGYSSMPSKPHIEIFNMETHETINVKIDDGILLGTMVKVEDGSILFIGSGREHKTVYRFDPLNKKLYPMPLLPKSITGSAFLLNNNNILMVRGGIYTPDYIRGISLEHGIYDYKNNKVYKRKFRYDCFYQPYIIPLSNNMVYISGFKYEKPMLYKY